MILTLCPILASGGVVPVNLTKAPNTTAQMMPASVKDCWSKVNIVEAEDVGVSA